jgi:predicted NBD/HSP70 family sugar kinase
MRRIDFTNTRVASSEIARDINRGVVLNLIRRRQPISRADLARVSGLQRSTVSLITEQLIEEQWVINGPTGHLPRGRRPTFLRLNEQRAILVADLRPEQTTVAVADVNGRFLSQEAVATPAHPHAAATVLADKFRRLMQSHRSLVFEGIGISLPGRFNHATRRVVFAPNLKWRDFDFQGALESATGVRVELENAANACVLAEVWFGQMDRVRDLAVVTVSEGIGAGLFINGHMVSGFNGMAGEFGHVPIEPEGLPCACGRRGCWEMYASNRAALRYYHESRPEPAVLNFPDLLTLADTGDTLAAHALDKMAHAIGRGMRVIVAGLAPEEIVVVGELTRNWQKFGPVIQAEVAAGALVGNPPRVRPAEGSMARLRGTVALVLQKHFGPALVPEKEQSGLRAERRSVTAS